MGITLYHVPISHFSEKVRWALDLKQVPHERRALLGGSHPLVVAALTRGRHQTVPLLTIDGRAIGDSTAILAELEARFPDPPLLPPDEPGRRRALELEELFDREVGPAIRRLHYHEITADPAALREVTARQVPWVPAAGRRFVAPLFALGVDQRFGVRSAQAAEAAEARVLAALDRLEAELDGRDHLVGDALSVADITAASLFYPLAQPPEGPWVPEHLPAVTRRRHERLAGRPGVQWVLRTYARHRRPAV